MEYYLAIERNELLMHATTRMNLQGIMVSEKKPIPKDCVSCDSITFFSDKIIEIEDRLVVSRGQV